MACSSCKSPEETRGADLTYTTHVETVMARNGQPMRVDGPLIPLHVRPLQGWHVHLLVGGQQIRVDGGSPKTTYKNARTLLDQNGVQVSDRDLWVNLNIQWMQRCNQAKLPVPLTTLIAATEAGQVDLAPTRDREQSPPSEWGPKAWGFLQQYLALDQYDHGKFLSFASEILDWVNPTKNPTTGCAECYRDYSILLKGLRERPAYTQEDARKWLVSTMNAIRAKNGKAPLSLEAASEINHW